MDRTPLIFLVAGEPSGDQLGARLMAALRAESGGKVRFAGVGGARMQAEGLESLFPIDELAIMGLFEVLPKIAMVYRRIRQTVAAARALGPAAVVTIDAPSFTLEVSQRLKGQGIPLIHYVAPSVWAWKAWRAKRMARDLDMLLTLLPFEPSLFRQHGLETHFVGHPAAELSFEAGQGGDFRSRHGIAPDATVIALLPGSRRGEVRRLLPVFAATAERLAQKWPGLHFVVPTVPTVAAIVGDALADWTVPVTLLPQPEDKLPAFRLSKVALAASGTVAVELAAAEVPTVVTYRLNNLSVLLFSLVTKTPYVSLPNILLGKESQPELIQWNSTPERLAAQVERLLAAPTVYAQRVADCRAVRDQLSSDGQAPSHVAARCVLSAIRQYSPPSA